MITVQGPAWALTIAALLQLVVESTVYARARFRDLRVWWSGRHRLGTMPKGWRPGR